MTEELKKEAEDWIIKNSKEFITNPNYSPFDYAEATYLAGAEPREKQILIDAEHILALQKQNGELTDKVKELEAQIEKMKRYLDCEYCEHYTQSYGCKNCNEEIRSDWKLKEKK